MRLKLKKEETEKHEKKSRKTVNEIEMEIMYE
jgi:hypothetical protein